MSDQDTLLAKAQAWLEPLGGSDGPCGQDLEYDNAFLELSKAAEGKPETQFDKGSPPDWRGVRSQAEDLLERSRDLRVALLWQRAVLNVDGATALQAGLALVTGLLERHWEAVHPVPDPTDNDPYARANALAVLPQKDGLLGDLLNARLAQIKGVGDVRLRDVEVALGSRAARAGESAMTREQIERMLGAVNQEDPTLRASLVQSQALIKQLWKVMDERFGPGSGSELKPLVDLIGHVMPFLPEPVVDTAEADGQADGEGAGTGTGGSERAPKAGLSGSVSSRAEALRALELVCVYLERYEPSNPAQLFVRRASALIERNFLELLKELAPNALAEVAHIVGVDPNTVGESGQ